MDHDDTENPPSDEVVPDGNPQSGTLPAPPFDPDDDLIVDMERDPNRPPRQKRHWFKRRQHTS